MLMQHAILTAAAAETKEGILAKDALTVYLTTRTFSRDENYRQFRRQFIRRLLNGRISGAAARDFSCWSTVQPAKI